jgi:hypothetical protein
LVWKYLQISQLSGIPLYACPMNKDDNYKEITPRFGRLLVACFAAVIFCGVLVWFASTYLLDCCGP